MPCRPARGGGGACLPSSAGSLPKPSTRTVNTDGRFCRATARSRCIASCAAATAVEAAALADEKVQVSLAGKTPKKVIVVAGKLVNLVV